MKINCVSCGHKVDLSDAYYDFGGQIKCYVCGTLLEINTSGGQLKSIRVAHLLHGAPDHQSSKEASRLPS